MIRVAQADPEKLADFLSERMMRALWAGMQEVQ